MVSERIKLVVADEHTLGYVIPNSEMVGVLHASILKGATWCCPASIEPKPIGMFKNIRLASEKDFDDFRVSFEGYKKDSNYEFAK